MNESKIITSRGRNSNLELYRIIVMLFIIAHHFVVNSGVMQRMYEEPLGANSIFLFLFGAWGKTGINCFILITGYFMCTSNISFKKFVKLVCEVLFYNIILSIIFLLTGYGTIKDVVDGLLIVRNINNNFTPCFLVFYLFIPFLNILIRNINQKQHQYLILLSSFLYVFLGTVPKFSVTMNYVSWFSFLYIVASYVRLYPIKKLRWGVLSIIFIVIAVVSVIACLILGLKTDKQMAYRFVSDSNSFLAFAIGFCSFMFFKDLRIKQSKVINLVGGSTFGVLCIHANSNAMRSWLWGNVLNVDGSYSMPIGNLVIYSILSVLGVFLICTVIDLARNYLIEIPITKRLDDNSTFKKIRTKFENY